jgi:hypothetical protein
VQFFLTVLVVKAKHDQAMLSVFNEQKKCKAEEALAVAASTRSRGASGIEEEQPATKTVRTCLGKSSIIMSVDKREMKDIDGVTRNIQSGHSIKTVVFLTLYWRAMCLVKLNFLFGLSQAYERQK